VVFLQEGTEEAERAGWDCRVDWVLQQVTKWWAMGLTHCGRPSGPSLPSVGHPSLPRRADALELWERGACGMGLFWFSVSSVVSCETRGAFAGETKDGAPGGRVFLQLRSKRSERFYTAIGGRPVSLKSGCKTPPPFNRSLAMRRPLFSYVTSCKKNAVEWAAPSAGETCGAFVGETYDGAPGGRVFLQLGSKRSERFYTAIGGRPVSLKSGCKTPPPFNRATLQHPRR